MIIQLLEIFLLSVPAAIFRCGLAVENVLVSPPQSGELSGII